MTSYLLQWNPKTEQEDFVYRGFEDGCLGWTCASQKAQPGDEVYLRRCGKDWPGIVAWGQITGRTKPFLPSHWRGKGPTPGVWFDVLGFSEPDQPALIPDDKLLRIEGQFWRSQSCGISINDAAAAKLRRFIDRLEQTVDGRIAAALGGVSSAKRIAALKRALANEQDYAARRHAH
jgi:hypothetical protein